MKFGTKTIHAGAKPDPSTGALATPIFQTSTYVQESPGKHKGYEYSRAQNPTRTALQENLAALENAKHGLCFSSGVAAADAVLKLLEPGDEVLCCNDIYGGNYRLFTEIYQKLGIKFTFVDMTDLTRISKYINKKVKIVWAETPTNPMLNVIDIKGLAGLVRDWNTLLVVDNTFASPYLQNPLDHGAHIVLHSASKYLSGHSDVIMGALMLNKDSLQERLQFIQSTSGAVPGPMDCYLVLRGVKTLHVRMQRHCENGRRIAFFLKSHPLVNRVNWPGFDEHPNHDIAEKQMKDFGGMLSFELKDDSIDATIALMEKFKLFSVGESLGGVESLASHPASMSHASVPREERLKYGLKDSFIRLSVGIEAVEDLIEDLEKALG